ncbi:MAG: HD domain-containing phosphohydrolase [Terriglobia bacterium]|jgi:HD-GYP domain-containing protein (c-di-GMP phosphodiesterase class II)
MSMPSNLYYFDPCAAEASLQNLGEDYLLISIPRGGGRPPVWELPAVILVDAAEDDLARVEKSAPKSEAWRIICLLDGDIRPSRKLKPRIFAMLPRDVSCVVLEKTVEKAFENLRAQEEQDRTRQELRQAVSDLETLNKIGVALSTERNTDSLLELILSKSREITYADAGSLYLVDEEIGGGKQLVFKLTQNDSHSVPFRQFKMDIDTRSISGYAAATGQILNIKDAYRIRNLPFRLNRDFDQKFGYRTKSMLVLPMKNQKDEVIGVLQLINSKKHPGVKLTSPRIIREEVGPFSPQSQDLASSLASQAAVALENNRLYRDIEKLFEGFVGASVTAIESRDPTTFGHSERVAKLTVALAETVDRMDSGPYKDVHFTREDIREIRYASILHDFGKVGVREEVLVKAKKLYPPQLELIKKRFQYIRKSLELEACRKKLDHVLRNGNQGYEECFGLIESEHCREVQNLDDFLHHILEANEPTVLPEKTSEKLVQIAGWSFDDPSGPTEPLLTPDELQLLSITKGSLNEEERIQIESHVIHSYRFLAQIPWTKELLRIPEIAKAHHEKLDGSGYPYHMTEEEIPFQSKMMTISDIFDALTARDRPYKRAVPTERALTIIGDEVKSQLLDPVLFNLFIEAKIYQLTAKD